MTYPPLYAGPEHPGRRQMRRFSLLTWTVMPDSLAARYFAFFDRDVPPEFWTEDVEEDGTPVAILACVCGETPKVPVYHTAACPGCDRVFANLSGRVKVGKIPEESGEEESSDAGRKLEGDDDDRGATDG